jgi:RNA polymerase sigma-70 factor (ECF subfamily)
MVITDQGFSFEDQLVRHLPQLRAFARFLVKDRSQADDLVSETVVRALSARKQFQPGTNLRAWLFVILRNCHINGFRQHRIGVEQVEDVIDASTPTPPDQLAAVELREVRQALTKVSPQHREVLALVAGAGLSYEETAQICKCAVGTVKSRLNRARSELKQVLTTRTVVARRPSAEPAQAKLAR